MPTGEPKVTRLDGAGSGQEHELEAFTDTTLWSWLSLRCPV